MEADDRASLQGPQWLTSLLLELAPFLQYGQTPQTKLLIAFHLRTPTHPHSEWETHTHTHHVASSPSCQIKQRVCKLGGRPRDSLDCTGCGSLEDTIWDHKWTSRKKKNSATIEDLSALSAFYHTHHIPVIPLYQTLLVTDFHFRVSRLCEWSRVSNQYSLSLWKESQQMDGTYHRQVVWHRALA